MEEIWKEIEGFKGYEVSSLGRVRSWRITGRGRKPPQEAALKAFSRCRKYLQVRMTSDEGVKKTCKVHRLVAIAFLPNPRNLPQVNHKDENPENNEVTNLEWCTSEYNQIYSFGEAISVVSPDGIKISGESIRQLSRKTGLDAAALYRLKSGEYKNTKGWVLHV